jgi:hypothetical protein
MYVIFSRDLEIACDESVVRSFGEPSSYALALIGMEERKARFAPLYSGFSKYAIEERICSIMKNKKNTIWGLMLAFILILTITAAFATSCAKIDVLPDDTSSDAAEPGSIADEPANHLAASNALRYAYGLRRFMPAEWRENETGARYYLENPVNLGKHGTITAVYFSNKYLYTEYDSTFAKGLDGNAREKIDWAENRIPSCYYYHPNDRCGTEDHDCDDIVGHFPTAITSEDGSQYVIGGYDGRMASYFRYGDWAYEFSPSQVITLQYGNDDFYEIQLTRMPEEYISQRESGEY